MTSNLYVSLKAPHDASNTSGKSRNFEVRQTGLPADQFDSSTLDFDVSYLNESGREPLQTLELQLAGRAKNSRALEEELEKVKEENKNLKNRINSLNKQLDESKIQNGSLEQEKAVARERNNHLQQEINRIRQEWLLLKEGLSSESQQTARYLEQIDQLQAMLSKSRSECSDMKCIVIEEQEKGRLSERERGELTAEVERLAADTGRLSAEKVGMEERNIELQEQLAGVKEQCNQMMVDRSHQLALLEELRAERDRYRDNSTGRDDINQRLKELVRDNQRAAEDMTAQIDRLNGEVEQKNNHISKLKNKLSRVQKKYSVSGSDVESLPGDAVSVTSDGAPADCNNTLGSVTATFNGNGSQRTELHTQVSNGGVFDSKMNGTSYESEAGVDRRLTPYNRKSSPTTPTLTGSAGRIPGVGSSSSDEATRKEEVLQREISLLQGQLKAARELNDHLKQENSLYVTMQNKSIGVQSSPNTGSFSTQVGSSSEMSVLEHLEEIRLLRLRLEDSIEQNNRLRELLERQLADMGVDRDTVHQYMRGVQQDSQSLPTSHGVRVSLDGMTQELKLVQQEVEAKNREIAQLSRDLQVSRHELSESRRDQQQKDHIFQEIEERLRTKDDTIHMMNIDAETKAANLKAARTEIKQLKDEVNLLRAGAEEQQELNKTLKLELSVLDNLNETNRENVSPDAKKKQSDMTLLMQELRQLRIQLEKSIENNNLLRQKLDEYLTKGRPNHSNASSPLSSYDCDVVDNGILEEPLDALLGKTIHTDTSGRHGCVKAVTKKLFADDDDNNGDASKYNKYMTGGQATSALDLSELGKHVTGSDYSGLRKNPFAGSDPSSLAHRSALDNSTGRGLHLSDLHINKPTRGDSVFRPFNSDHSTLLDGHEANGTGYSGTQRSPVFTGSRHSSRSHTPVNQHTNSPPTKLSRAASLDRHSIESRNHSGSRHDTPERPRDVQPTAPEDPLSSIISMHHSPGSHGSPKPGYLTGHSGDGSMRYSVLDPKRPPGSTTLRVGADLRQLYAIGELDDYELLKKEIGESHSILSGMEARVRERLTKYRHASQTESAEYQTLRDIVSSIHQAKSLSGEASRLVSLFWMSQLPLRDHTGNFIDVRMLKQNQGLQDELHKYKRECTRLKGQLSDASVRMKIASKGRDDLELELLKQLNDHHFTLRKSNNNLSRYITTDGYR